MLRLSTVLLTAVFLSGGWHPVQAGKVYKWIDAEGRIHFSDNPVGATNAEEVKIRTLTEASDVVLEGDDYGPREVKILSTTWCGVCKKAKNYLAAKGIYFSEYDVETSDIGRQEYKRLVGKGVPIILVGNQRMDGFTANKLEEMLKNVGYP
ncbi:MAG: glutaredoxin family protein [Sulfuricaulis sp.]|nr:glutaredoxin family protein [Sulfuricaulis sp.]